MVGLIVMLVGILRLGWIAEFLSAPIITGFLSGVAVIIVIHQLPDFFGLPATTRLGPTPLRLRGRPLSEASQRLDARHRAGRPGLRGRVRPTSTGASPLP